MIAYLLLINPLVKISFGVADQLVVEFRIGWTFASKAPTSQGLNRQAKVLSGLGFRKEYWEGLGGHRQLLL